VTAWRTCDLPDQPSYTSPGGASEIRMLPNFPSGELTHATARPGEVSVAAVVTGLTEFFYVLSGHGELWRRTEDAEETVGLVPERCATIPPSIDFQYRTEAEPLEFIVFTAPRWERDNWSEGPVREWPAADPPAPAGDVPWNTLDLAEDYDYLAPDGSEIRLLTEVEAGGLAHCTLPAGRTSAPVRHRTVEEIWYVLSGLGEMWRGTDGDEEVVRLHERRAVTIPTGIAFQFRATTDLRILIGTFPRWPGEDEAVPVSPGRWS
jgi:mannose-6-phosphate isomerase-like protein (cupin superfamily)